MSSADYGTTVDVRGIDSGDEEDKYTRPHRCCVRYGNTWVLCSLSARYGFFPRTCHVGPNWPCMLVTYCIAIGPLFLFFMYVCAHLFACDVYLFVQPVIRACSQTTCWLFCLSCHGTCSLARCVVLLFAYRKDDLALGLQVALVASVVLTTCAFTMVACSDPGVVFESYEAPSSVQVGDAELGPGVVCGALCIVWLLAVDLRDLLLLAWSRGKLISLARASCVCMAMTSDIVRCSSFCMCKSCFECLLASVVVLTLCLSCATLAQRNARSDGRTTRRTARTAVSALARCALALALVLPATSILGLVCSRLHD